MRHMLVNERETQLNQINTLFTNLGSYHNLKKKLLTTQINAIE